MDLVKEINDFYYHMALYELQVMNGNDYYNAQCYAVRVRKTRNTPPSARSFGAAYSKR